MGDFLFAIYSFIMVHLESLMKPVKRHHSHRHQHH